MPSTWLSVIVPTYNGARYLGAALQSLEQQGAYDLEVVVVDDGSKDETLRIARDFKDRLCLQILTGLGGNWVRSTNQGLARATGEYASILHQDDLWGLTRARRLHESLSAAPCDLLIHDAHFIDQNGRKVGRLTAPLPEGDVSQLVAWNRLIVQNFLVVPTTAFNRSLALDLGGLDESLRYTADWDLWLRLIESGHVRYLHETLASFRLHPGAQTLDAARDLPEFRRQHEVVLERHWTDRPLQKNVERAARASININVALAASLLGERKGLMAALGQLVALGPSAASHYLTSSRILQRAAARMRAGIVPRQAPS